MYPRPSARQPWHVVSASGSAPLSWAQPLRRSLEPADARYALGVGLCYVAVVSVIRFEDFFSAGPDGEATLLAAVLCIEVASIVLLIKAFRRLFRRADEGCSRVFWCTFAANILFSSLVAFMPFQLR